MPDEFLSTHCSLTAATREFTRLGDSLADGASGWGEEMDGRDTGAGELLVIH